MKFFVLIWAGLWRKPARTILTMLSVVIALLLFGVLQGINQGINATFKTLDNRLFISSRSGDADLLPISYLGRIQAVPGVQGVAHISVFGGYYQDKRNSVLVLATNADEMFKVYAPMFKIPPEQLQAMARTRTGAIVAQPLAAKYGWKLGDRVPINTYMWAKKDGHTDYQFDIVGIYQGPGQQGLSAAFFINYDYLEEARAFGGGMVNYYIIGVADPSRATVISQSIDRMFANSSYETRTQTEQAFLQSQLKQIADVGFIVNAIVGGVLFTLLFLTANTMMQSVRERIPELAVLKTLGFRDTTVAGLVLAEALLLCVVAGLLGLCAAEGVFQALAVVLGPIKLPAVVFVSGLLMAVLVAIISALPPAVRVQRMKLVDALAGR